MGGNYALEVGRDTSFIDLYVPNIIGFPLY